MKNIALIAVIIMFGFLIKNVNSQSLPTRVLYRLKSYEKPKEGMTFENGEKSSIIWTVYSDRNGNNSYTEPGGSDVKCSLAFMDAFCVLEERGNSLWLIKPELVDEDGYVFSDAEDCGWVEKDKMLLWSNCLITNECSLNRKAMILNTIDAFKERIEDVEFARFYYDPQLRIASDLKSSVYKIYFVYKSSPNSVLLGRKSNFSFSGSKESIVGWVRKSRITPWDHRLAIEPNWTSQSVSERKSNEIKLRFFDSEEVASQYYSSGTFSINNRLWEENPYYEERKIGEYPRFPVLYDDGDNLVKVGIIDKMTSKYGTINLDSASVIAEHIGDWRSATKNINIVFVIDGSTSMQPYFKPVAKAVKNSMNELSKKTNNVFRFAAVVYRDYGEGARTIESIGLKSDYKKTAKFLDNITAKNVFDMDTPEAVNYGLKNAILGVGLPKDETNVIVLIGDAGNHHRSDETQVSDSDIIDLLDEYECHLLAFQVQHPTHPSYNEFNEQAKKIILDLANLKYERIKEVNAVVNANLHPPEFLPPQNGLFELNETAIVASLVSCEINKTVPPEQIGAHVEDVIIRINKFINDLKDEVQTVVVEGDELVSDVSLGPAFLYALKKAGLSDDEIKFYCARNSQMYYEGYGSITNSKVNNPLAKYILFMDKVELTDLLEIFDELLNATSYNDKRKKMKEAWIEILRKHIGDSEKIEIENLKLGELSSKILCLPKSSKFLTISLNQITDPKKFSDYEFNKYMKSISNKRNNLRKIYKDKNYIYSFLSDDKTYYWIDMDLLP
jgi:hypothetical protein